MPPPPTPTLIPSHPHHPSPNNPSHTPYFHTVLNTTPPPAARPRNPSSATGTSSTRAKGSTSGFTAAQRRSAQARGEPYAQQDEHHGGGRGVEGFEQRKAREIAATVLENYETLSWYSFRRNESLSQTRRHFEAILLGLETSPPPPAPTPATTSHSTYQLAAPTSSMLYREEYEIPENQRVRYAREDDGTGTGSPRSGKGKERERERMKRFGVGVSV